MKQQTRIALATVLVAAPALSMAANEITFKGKVNNQTCQASIDGKANATVELPGVPASELDAPGKTTGLTPFIVTLKNCQANNAIVNVGLTLSGASLDDNGTMKNILSGNDAAKNVSLQLLQDAVGGSAINLGNVTQMNGLQIAANATEASHEFAVRYYATGVATPGNVQAVINYDIVYP